MGEQIGEHRPALVLQECSDPRLAIATMIRCQAEHGRNVAIIYGGTKGLPFVGGPETTV